MFQRTIRNVVPLRFCKNTSCSAVYADEHAHYAHIKIQETMVHSQSFNNHVSQQSFSHYRKDLFHRKACVINPILHMLFDLRYTHVGA